MLLFKPVKAVIQEYTKTAGFDKQGLRGSIMFFLAGKQDVDTIIRVQDAGIIKILRGMADETE